MKIFIALLFHSALFVIVSCTSPQQPVEEQVLVRVNNQSIPARDFILSFRQLRNEQDDASQKNPKLIEQLKLRSLNELIITVLLRQEATKRNLRVAREEIDGRLTSWRDSYPPGGFEEMLSRRNTTEDYLKRRIEEQLLIEKLTDTVFSQEVLVSDDDLKRQFTDHEKEFVHPERLHAFQIVVPTKEEAEKIRQDIVSGKNSFESAARGHSLSPDATKGGDLGFFSKGEKIAAFDQAFSLSVGSISKPIESRYGWHLLKVVEKIPSRKLSLNEAKNELLKSIRRSRQSTSYKEWVNKLLKDGEIYRNETLFSSLS